MDLVIRTAVMYVFLLVLMRVMGRRELASLEPFDLILLIVVGDALQQGLTQDDYSVTGAVLVVGTFAILQVATSWISYRFPKARTVLEGEPLIVVENGNPIARNLKRERLTIEEIAEAARMQQIGRLDEVQWAVLERNGQLTFIKKSG
jgi:uncharacterized membrane protein YcaP (DUF421 family)